MKETAHDALSRLLGARWAGGVAAPREVTELAALLALMREQGLRVGRDLTLDRRLFDAVLGVNAPSGLLEVGAGMTLEAVERVAGGHGLTLGALPPSVRRAPVHALLEGPRGGLRAIPGGRLEPLAMSIRAVLGNGQLFESPSAPRSAAGPGLEHLLLGGGGRLGLIVSAQLRALPLPQRTEHVTISFPSAASLVSALRLALDDGASIPDAQLYRRDSAHVVHARFSGTEATAVRDANTLARRGAARGGRLSDPDLPVWSAASERELSWGEVTGALEAEVPLRLYRLAVESVIAESPRALPEPSAAPPALTPLWSAVARAVDPDSLLGGDA